MVMQGCVYKGKVRPVILEQLKAVTLNGKSTGVGDEKAFRFPAHSLGWYSPPEGEMLIVPTHSLKGGFW